MIMFVDLQHKKSLKWITVGVTHFPLEEDLKLEATHITRQLISSQKLPCFVYGDYNFFDDKDGTSHRNIMYSACTDIAAHLITEDKQQLSGTFIGFCHDDFKRSFENMSRLDHVFTPWRNGISQTGMAVSPFLSEYNLDNSDYNFNYPSDHLAIKFYIEI